MKFSQSVVLQQWGDEAILGFSGKFCNLYALASSDVLALIDPGLPSDVVAFLEFVGALSIHQSARVQLIVLTHLHIDHVAGVTLAAEMTGALVAMGKWTKPFLAGEKIAPLTLRHWICELLPMWHKEGHPIPNLFDIKHSCIVGLPFIRNQLQPPVSIWLQEDELLPGFSDWRVLHLPGHTVDSIGLLNAKKGILIAGDLILNFYGSGEFSNIISDRIGYQKSTSLVRQLKLTGILPGHGEAIWGNDVAAGVVFRTKHSTISM